MTWEEISAGFVALNDASLPFARDSIRAAGN
jgi:hypothetical protein